jgi:micrococcal nuclease
MKPAYQYRVFVTRVIDGDTFDGNVDLGMDVSLAGQRFRMIGINTPERDENGYREATDYLREQLHGQTVVIVSHDRDVFGRWLVDVYREGEDVSLNQELLDKGLAKVYRRPK